METESGVHLLNHNSSSSPTNPSFDTLGPQLDKMATFESAHVHAVYDQIALDFSRTRHTRWPFCQRWLEALPTVAQAPTKRPTHGLLSLAGSVN